MFPCRRSAEALALLGLLALPAAGEPRSAIPWLTESLKSGEVAPPAPVRRTPHANDGIEVTTLGPPPQDGAGLLSSLVTGLPRDLWGPSSSLRARLATAAVRATGVPGAQELYRTLLLASTLPPRGAGPGAVFLGLRVEKLMDMGALDEALELVIHAAPPTADFIARRFDLALLTGQEGRACEVLLGTPSITPTARARIFCLARSDAWAEAVFTLAVARTAGDVTREEDALFSRFLDLDEVPDGAPIALPAQITPLSYLMLLAIGAGGEATAETDLPVAFTTLDLARTAPPRARMLAAERLVAAGGITYPILFFAYRSEPPAASGGVWDRAAAVQALDAALAEGDPARIAGALGAADAALAPLGLRVALAREYAPALAHLPRDAAHDPDRLATLLLLGGEAAAASAWLTPGGPPHLRTAHAAATGGAPPGPSDRTSAIEAAVAAAFSPGPPDTPLYRRLAELLAQGRRGEALMLALRLLDAGTGIDPGTLAACLRLIAEAGQAETARRIAVETLLLAETRP